MWKENSVHPLTLSWKKDINMPGFIKITYLKAIKQVIIHSDIWKDNSLFLQSFSFTSNNIQLDFWNESKSEAIEPNLSGYYCYDEQYLKIDGKRSYRINLIDSILNKPVRESIVNVLEYDTVKSFIEKAISGIPVHAITTDHRREYKSIMDELKINHQLCIFHLFKMIGKEIFPKLRSKFISNTNKIRLCILFTEIKEISELLTWISLSIDLINC